MATLLSLHDSLIDRILAHLDSPADRLAALLTCKRTLALGLACPAFWRQLNINGACLEQILDSADQDRLAGFLRGFAARLPAAADLSLDFFSGDNADAQYAAGLLPGILKRAGEGRSLAGLSLKLVLQNAPLGDRVFKVGHGRLPGGRAGGGWRGSPVQPTAHPPPAARTSGLAAALRRCSLLPAKSQG